MHASPRIFCLVLIASCVGCPAPPADPDLDAELERYRSLKNESIDLACVCPMSVIGFDGEPFETEAECLADAPRVKPSGLACMKDALVTVYGNETEGATLIACYNTAIQDYVGCLEANVGGCDPSTSHCSVDFDSCDGSLTQQQSETIVLCAFQ